MNTNDFNSHQKKIELLTLARQQLCNELVKNKNDAHANWQKESEAAWLTNGKLLPYPPTIPAFPTEKEVVARALELYNRQQPIPDTPVPAPEPIKETSPWVAYLAPEPEVLKSVEPVVSLDKVEEPKEPMTGQEESSEDASLKNLISKFLTLARELDANKENKNVS